MTAPDRLQGPDRPLGPERPQGEDEPVLRGQPIAFAPELFLGRAEAARLREALGTLLGPTAPSSLLAPVAQPLVLKRAEALDCAAELVEAADRALLAGECVTAYALFGIEGQLLDALVGEGREG